MPVKLTIHFNYRTTATGVAPKARSAHWTEIHYVNAADIPTARAIVINGAAPAGGVGILDRRAALLPFFGDIWRYDLQVFQLVAGQGESPSGPNVQTLISKPGLANVTGDIPQQSILIHASLGGGQPKTVNWPIRCIPDDMVVGGELELTVAFRGAVVDYGLALQGQYGTYVDNRLGAAGVGQPVRNIDVDGVVTGTGAITILNVGDVAKVTRSRNSDGRKTGGTYRVGAVDGVAGTVTLEDWDRGATTGGTIRKWERVFAPYLVVTTTGFRQMTRKVGTYKDYKAVNRRNRS